MANEGTFKAWINPLAFPGVDLARAGDAVPDAEAMLSVVCRPGVPHDTGSLVDRSRRISARARVLFAAPDEPAILEKLVWPLREAKASYVLGNHLAVVAMCGLVAEMVAVLLMRLAEVELRGKEWKEGGQATYEEWIEGLGQARREKILRQHSLVGQDVVEMFRTIRLTRSGYLHRWSQGHASLAKDAEACFHAATGLVVEAIGQDVREGRIVLNPRLIAYLEREGVYRPGAAAGT